MSSCYLHSSHIWQKHSKNRFIELLLDHCDLSQGVRSRCCNQYYRLKAAPWWGWNEVDDSMCVMLGWKMVGYLRTWTKIWLINVYKGRGNVFACGSNRGKKLMKQAILVLGRLIEGLRRFKVEIQFGFMAGRSICQRFFGGGGVEEAARARECLGWVHGVSSIFHLTVWGASYMI